MDYDVIVIGCGIGGSALSCSLDGKRVCVIEKDWSEASKIIGEYMQPGGIEFLRKLELENCVKEIDSFETSGAALITSKGRIVFSYPERCKISTGRTFEHKKFLAKLREKVHEKKNVSCISGTVNSLIRSEDGRVVGVGYTNPEGKRVELRSHLVVVSDGCFSRFRPEKLRRKFSVTSLFVGFEITGCSLPHENRGNFILGSGCTVLMYRITEDKIRILVCLDRKDIPKDLCKATIDALKESSNVIPEYLYDAFSTEISPSTIKVMPNQRSLCSNPHERGAVYIGDSITARHPIAGGGMTACLNDVFILSNILKGIELEKVGAKVLDKAIDTFYAERRPLASFLSIFAHGSFCMFRQGTRARRLLRDKFLEYELQNKNRDSHMYMMSGFCTKRREFFLDVPPVIIYALRAALLDFKYPKTKQPSVWDIFALLVRNIIVFVAIAWVCATELLPYTIMELMRF